MLLSIAIATHNRADLLREALEALCAEVGADDRFEVLVVDNCSSDNTAEIAAGFSDRIKNYRVISETELGASFARNTAAKEARGEWIAYLDDDGRILAGYRDRLLLLADSQGFGCIGGAYLPWYREGRKCWYRDSYGSNESVFRSLGRGDENKTMIYLLDDNQYAAAGNCLFRRSVLLEAGGFPTVMGPKGRVMFYGEETRLQLELRRRGERIGFDPLLRIEHLVPMRKQSVGWFLGTSFNIGRDSWRTFDQQPGFRTLLWRLSQMLTGPLKGLYREVRSREERGYWQNYAIATLSPLYMATGRVVGGIRQLFS